MLGEFSKKCFQAEFIYLESRILTFAAEVEVDDFDRECFYRENFLKTFFWVGEKKLFFTLDINLDGETSHLRQSNF